MEIIVALFGKYLVLLLNGLVVDGREELGDEVGGHSFGR